MTARNLSKVDVIDAFERLSLDSNLNFVLRAESGERIHVEFRRQEHPPWTIFLEDHRQASGRKTSRHKLADLLSSVGSSLAALEAEISANLLLQAGYCDLMVREIGHVFGQGSLRQAVLEIQRLMDDLGLSVRQVVGPPKQEPATTTASTHESSAPQGAEESSSDRAQALRSNRSKLRIIRD